ncbi:MAG TPA: type II 3-dehydroquinate dehydratase [Pelagibacterium sp.]|uniref:type II 3-dehydroquinate dehydratase n=1 Tax=Pelagibacterium sp. TaxID=1967288 RepID=UPI002C4E6308|nr:type II 3-dehydroquinate dehydratase [Pelagibacterium sp.]HWJ88600.1 type II 3-dehydroquinate dehydratase [Pelagibacterium sp.]
MAKRILILNGPNLNLLGTREKAIYGASTLADIEAMCRTACEALDLSCDFRQSNHEGELIDWIQSARKTADAIIINPAGYSHTSIAIPDALRTVDKPIVEVHITNIHQREAFRHHSYISAVASGVICGLGPRGYTLAIEAVAEILN